MEIKKKAIKRAERQSERTKRGTGMACQERWGALESGMVNSNTMGQIILGKVSEIILTINYFI